MEVLAEILCIVIQVIELFLVCLETLFQPIIVRFQIAYLALELFLFTMMFFLKNFFSISHPILSQLVSNQIAATTGQMTIKVKRRKPKLNTGETRVGD